MNIEKTIEATDTLLFAKTGQHLNTLENLVLRGALEHKAYKAMAAATYRSPKTLKDVGAQLWRKLSFALAEPVKKTTIRAQLERYQLERYSATLEPYQIQSNPTNRQDWADAPEISPFFGRKDELATLKQWILQDRCRLVAIVGMRGIGKTGLAVRLGMGGIGKTDLSLHLARGIQAEFDYVIWRSLLNAPSVHDILRNLIQFLSNQQVPRLPETVEAKTCCLLNYLKTQRCLLILDNLESVLVGSPKNPLADTLTHQAGHYREGYEGYSHLLQKLGEVPHQSCLILTSREKPKDLQNITNSQGKTRFLQLQGLDIEAAKNIFHHQEVRSNTDQEIEEVIRFYEGNPLALKLVSKRVKSVFNSDISEFLDNEKPSFGDINELLDWHFERLSLSEKEVLYWLAINREPTAISTLRQDILALDLKNAMTDIIEALSLRLPINRTALGFTLQPVIIEYLTAKIVGISHQEIYAGKFCLSNRVCLQKASAKTYVRDAQTRLLVTPLVERLVDAFKHKSLVIQHLKTSVSLIKDSLDWRSGYITGNLITLLRQLGADLSGYNFSYLAIRQVFLQTTSLHNVSFAHCDLSTAMFTRSFGGVHSVAFSPDNQHLAIGDCKGQIRLLRRENCQQVRLLEGHRPNFWVTALAFSPDRSILASSSFDKTVRLWDLETGQCLHTLEGHSHWLWAVAVSSDSCWVASSGDDCTVRLWNTATGDCANILTDHANWVWAIAFHPNSALLASGSYDCTIRLWDVQTGNCMAILDEHPTIILVLAFSPDGEILASGGADYTIRFWDVETRRCLQVLQGHTREVRSLVFTPDGQFLVSGSFDGSLRLWEVNTGRCIMTLAGHTVAIRSVDISPDGELLVSGDHSQSLRLWETATGQCLQTLKGYVSWIWSVAVNPDTQEIATGCLDGNIHLWDLKTGTHQQTIKGHGNWIWQVKYNPDREYFVSCSCTDDETLKFWHPDGQWLATLEGHRDGGVWTADFSPDGRILITGGQDGTIRYWDTQSHACLQTIRAHNNWIWAVVFNQDGSHNASCSDDGTIKLWDTKNRQLQRCMATPGSKVLSLTWIGNGDILAGGYNDGVIRLWESSTGRLIRTIEGHQHWVLALAFNPLDQTLWSGAQDNTIRVWDLETGSCLAVLTEHLNWVTSIDFYYEDNLAITGSADGSVKVWDLASRHCLRTLKLPLPYEGMDITCAVGLTDSQKASLRSLGAIAHLY